MRKKNTRRRTSTLFYRTNILFATPPSFAKEGKKENGERLGLALFRKRGWRARTCVMSYKNALNSRDGCFSPYSFSSQKKYLCYSCVTKEAKLLQKFSRCIIIVA